MFITVLRFQVNASKYFIFQIFMGETTHTPVGGALAFWGLCENSHVRFRTPKEPIQYQQHFWRIGISI
jgi:hypothetical protein